MKGPIVGTIIAPLITAGMYFAALEAQTGAVREFSGRNSAIKSLVYSLGGMLGPMGSIVVGALVTMGMIAWLVVSIKNRKKPLQA